MVADLERLTLTFWGLVQRIRRLPMPEAARARILADLEALYRRERAELPGSAYRSSTATR
jgi:hypothetical protein